jgi:hypothetical protein
MQIEDQNSQPHGTGTITFAANEVPAPREMAASIGVRSTMDSKI